MKIIGFTAKKGTGKTTACNMIKDILGDKCVQVNFKDGLIESMKTSLPDTLTELGILYNMSIDDLFIKKPPAMRALMKNYGTDVIRVMYKNAFVSQWEEKVQEYADTDVVVLVDDVRFLNEAAVIRLYGGYLVKLFNPESVSTDTHRSETEMDAIVANFEIETEQGNLDLLRKNIEYVLEYSIMI